MHNLEALSQALSKGLAQFPETEALSDYLDTNSGQDKAHVVFLTYLGLTDRLARLNPRDLAIVGGANRLLNYRYGADYFLSEIDDLYKQEMVQILMNLTDPNLPVSQMALEDLFARMAKTQQLKVEKLQPSDNDPRFDYCLWGYSQIGGVNGLRITSLLHYTMTHLDNRLLDAYLTSQDSKCFIKGRGVRATRRKDFLVNPLEDIVTLEGLLYPRTYSPYNIWTKPQIDGGLGWISQEKVKAYRAVFKNLGIVPSA